MFPCKILLLSRFVRVGTAVDPAVSRGCLVLQKRGPAEHIPSVCQLKEKPAGSLPVLLRREESTSALPFLSRPIYPLPSYLPSFIDSFTLLGLVPLNLELSSYYCVNCEGPGQLLIYREGLEPAPSYPESRNFRTLVWCEDQDHLGLCRSWGRQGIFICISIR